MCLVHKELEGSSLGVVSFFFFFFLVGVGLGFCFGRGLGGGQHWEAKGGVVNLPVLVQTSMH